MIADPAAASGPRAGGATRSRRWGGIAVVGLLLGVTLVLSYAAKAVCIDGEPGFWGETRYCYSDVRVLWGFRGFDVDAVPYAEPPADYPDPYVIEYPPGLAFPAYAIGLATDSRRGFFDLTALTFAIAVVAAVWRCDSALRALGRPRLRVLGLVLAPSLVLFGMQNWDLWAVAVVAAGLASAARGRRNAAAAWFAVGAAIKWWPALLVVPLIVAEFRDAPKGERLRAATPAAVATVVWAAWQLPALLVSPSGWWASIEFHLGRQPNYDTDYAGLSMLGEWLFPSTFWGDPYRQVLTAVTFAALAAGVVFVATRVRRGRLGIPEACLALAVLFLLTQKVFSPQFALWLLPLAVVARVPWTPVLAVEFLNAIVWLLYGPWLGGSLGDGALYASQGVAFLRRLALAWLFVCAVRAVSTPEEAVSPREEEPHEHQWHRHDERDRPQPPAPIPAQ